MLSKPNMINTHERFLCPSGFEPALEAAIHQPFQSYIDITRTLVEQARIDLTNKNCEAIVNGNIPFEYLPKDPNAFNPHTKKYRRGVLLIHGLYESPYHMQALGRFFQSQGFLVRAMLLPGHGTVPGDLLKITCEAWISAAESAYKGLQNIAEQCFITGYSTGGTLGLHLALKKIDIAGLFLYAPAIQITPFARFARFFKIFYRRHWQLTNWFFIGENEDPYKYEAYTMNSADQVYRLIQMNNELLKNHRVELPLFMVLTANDHVTNPAAAMKYFHQEKNKQSKLILYTTRPQINDRDPRVIKRNSCYPDLKILNFSHTCLNKSIDDPHYGRNGDYTKRQMERLDASEKTVCFGELELQARSKHLARLYYNPDLPYLLDKMTQFIAID